MPKYLEEEIPNAVALPRLRYVGVQNDLQLACLGNKFAQHTRHSRAWLDKGGSVAL